MDGRPARRPCARTAPRRGPGPGGIPGTTWRLCIALCLLLIAALPAGPARAAEPGAVDVPVPESAADAPPPGVAILPGVTLSGYATLQYLSPDQRERQQQPQPQQPGLRRGPFTDPQPQSTHRPRLDLSHLSGIAWWEPSPTWKALVEVDLQDVVQVPAHALSQDGPNSSAYVALDRLYVDYRASDALVVRLGKFLTPIGRWNQEHSDPQVWTVLRPLISQSAFPTSASGVMVFGSVPVGPQWIDYQTYASNGPGWRPSPNSVPFDRAYGGRLSTALNPDLQVGVSLSRFAQQDLPVQRFEIAGVDASWSWHRAEFSGEAIDRRAQGGGPDVDEHGWFAQAVLPLVERWWGVARVEAYKRAGMAPQSRTSLVGVVYRSGRHWVFKAEWAHVGGDAQGLPSGLLSSVTLVY